MNYFEIILGVFLGGLLTRGWDEIRKPNLKIEIGEDGFWPNNSSSDVKFLHIKVNNVKRNWLDSIFFGNLTANNARAWVSFLDYPSKKELVKMNGRWTSKKEPVDYSTGKINLAEVLIPPRETIPSGEETNISITLKDKGKNNFYGFNNESYSYNWRKPEYELDEKRYIVRIRISSEGKDWLTDFVLLNPGKPLSNFKLDKSE